MAITRKQRQRERLAAYAKERPTQPVDGVEWESIREMLAPISERTLRTLLREAGLPMETLAAGVDQSNFDTLEASLMALLEVYRVREQAKCRRLVIRAKDHARWAANRANDEGKRLEKQEMFEWMRVWLENPAIFPAWVKVRRQITESRSFRA